MRYTHHALVAVAAGLPSFLAKPLYGRDSGTPMKYGFDQINATADLAWEPCFDIFTCTKVVVPLDYEDETAGNTHVSFIKWNSNSTGAQDILLNPGGPGGSGVEFLTKEFWLLHKVFGTDNNLVSFDPRGVNNSGPDVTCFPGKKGTGTSTLYDPRLFDPLDSNDTRSYGEVFARATAFGEFCTAAHSAANDTAKYANTVATATDMLHYTELLAKSKGGDAKTSQLWYYGISYGTVLGATYAALFPDRIGRLIVDGVVDNEDYFSGAWESNIVDADKVIDSFFQTCYEAGQGGNCSFWVNSSAAIQSRYEAIVDNLTLHPIPVVTSGGPTIFTRTNLKSIVRVVVYDPLLDFPLFADALVELEKGNGSAFAGFTSEWVTPDLEPELFIACTDANGRFNLTYEAWVEHAKLEVQESHYTGEAFATITGVNCRKLEIKAPDSQVMQWENLKADKTSNQLLFISNRYDPVTPIGGAKKMAARFGGSRLLEQASDGHWSLQAESQCTREYLRAYIQDASLPAEGMICQPDRFPFRDEVEQPDTGTLRKRHILRTQRR